MKGWSRFDGLVLVVFALLVGLFYWRILTPNLADRQSFPPGDFHAQFWAFATFEVRELSAGRLPLWNPYTFAGAPFWADVQSAVFYLPSLLTILLSAPWGFSLFALELEAIAHVWLAAVFMYLFGRALTQSRSAAFIAALTFTFSGYLTGYPSQQLAVLEAVVWLPLILFFLHQGIGRREQGFGSKEQVLTPLSSNPPILQSSTPSTSLRASLPPLQASIPPPLQPSNLPTFRPSILLAGLAWGMTLLAGHPQSALIVAYVSTAYFFFLWVSGGGTQLHPRPSFLRSTFNVLRYYLLFIGTGLGLAAIQFIPAVEYTLLSVRAEGTYEAMSGGFPIIDLVQLLLPGQVSLYSPLYVGIVGLSLALWVIFAAPSRQTSFWAVTGGLALLISLGGNSFFYSVLYLSSPGFAIFRGQERWALVVAFSLSVLAGYGFNAARQGGSRKQGAGSREQGLTPLSSTPPLLHSSTPPPLQPSNLPLFHPSPLPFSPLFLFALLLNFLFFYGLNETGWSPDSPFYNLLAGSTLLSLVLALAWLLWKFAPRLQPGLFTVLTAALIGFDLFSVNWTTNLYPQLPEWHTQPPAVVQAILADAAQTPGEPYRVYNEFRLFDNYGVAYGIEDLWGASPLRPARYDRFLAPPMPIERTWELLNVKYVITWREELYLPSTIIYQEPATDGTTYVHRLASPGPRAWLVTQTEIADDPTTLQRLADPSFDRWHIALLEANEQLTMNNEQLVINNEQLVINNEQLTTPPLHPSTPPPFHPSTPHSSSPPTFQPSNLSTFHPSTPQSLSLSVSTPTPALLVLSEPYYPGWQATVDGQSAPILRANYLLRAIPVPAGEHRIELVFQPWSLTLGAIISLLTLIAVSVTLVLIRRRSQK